MQLPKDRCAKPLLRRLGGNRKHGAVCLSHDKLSLRLSTHTHTHTEPVLVQNLEAGDQGASVLHYLKACEAAEGRALPELCGEEGPAQGAPRGEGPGLHQPCRASLEVSRKGHMLHPVKQNLC